MKITLQQQKTQQPSYIYNHIHIARLILHPSTMTLSLLQSYENVLVSLQATTFIHSSRQAGRQTSSYYNLAISELTMDFSWNMDRVRNLETRVRDKGVVKPRDVLSISSGRAAVVQPRKGWHLMAAQRVPADARDRHGAFLDAILVQFLDRTRRNWTSSDAGVSRAEQNQAAEGGGEANHWEHVCWILV